MVIYFVFVYITGNIFLLNMFVGVMVDNFGRMAVLLDNMGENPNDAEKVRMPKSYP